MRKLGLILLITGSTVVTALAQEQASDSWPYWTISKGIHQNKFKNVKLVPASIKTGNSDWVIAKGVHKSATKATSPSGTVAMTGYPTWTISKGVARNQAERNSGK